MRSRILQQLCCCVVFFAMFYNGIVCVSTTPTTVKRFYLTVGWTQGSPDGFTRRVLAVNNTVPGPLIEFNTGDSVEISVYNSNVVNGTTIHWHGLDQYGTPDMDGVASITQCVIPYQTTFVYKFTVPDQWGTYWYHSHTLTQYVDGALGTLVVHNPNEVYQDSYDEDVSIFLQDWYHTPAADLLAYYLSPASGGDEPNPDAALMNGIGRYDCSLLPAPGECVEVPRYKLTVTPGKSYRLRIINAAAFSHMNFSVDSHMLDIIEADGTDTLVSTVKSFTINIAQRYSVILTANQNVANYWIRVNITTADLQPGWNDSLTPWVLGILHYDGAPDDEDPTTTLEDQPQLVELDLQPYVSLAAPSPVTTFQNLTISFQTPVEGGTQYAYFNDISFVAPPTPVLLVVTEGVPLPLNLNPIYLNVENEVIQVTLINYDNGEHPFHLHGHNFSVMGKVATLVRNGDHSCIIEEVDKLVVPLKEDNPLRRDTETVQGCGKMVFRFVANNPGVWFFHCHIEWHLEAGLALVFIELPKSIPPLTPEICNLVPPLPNTNDTDDVAVTSWIILGVVAAVAIVGGSLYALFNYYTKKTTESTTDIKLKKRDRKEKQRLNPPDASPSPSTPSSSSPSPSQSPPSSLPPSPSPSHSPSSSSSPSPAEASSPLPPAEASSPLPPAEASPLLAEAPKAEPPTEAEERTV